MPGESAAIGAVLGTVQTVAGLINADKAKQEAKRLRNSRPKYDISPNVASEVSLAESELANGMSAAATQAYETGIDKDLSSTIDAILKSGGTPNNVAQAFDSSAEGRQRLALMKDSLRLNHVNNLVSAYRNQNTERDKQFEFNDWMPWADDAQANAQARQSASSQIWGGINTLGNAAMSFAGTKFPEVGGSGAPAASTFQPIQENNPVRIAAPYDPNVIVGGAYDGKPGLTMPPGYSNFIGPRNPY